MLWFLRNRQWKTRKIYIWYNSLNFYRKTNTSSMSFLCSNYISGYSVLRKSIFLPYRYPSFCLQSLLITSELCVHNQEICKHWSLPVGKFLFEVSLKSSLAYPNFKMLIQSSQWREYIDVFLLLSLKVQLRGLILKLSVDFCNILPYHIGFSIFCQVFRAFLIMLFYFQFYVDHLTLSCIMPNNSQTYLKNPAVFTL